MVHLIKREGDYRHYSNGEKVVMIKLCLAPHVYVNPGYYIATCNGVAFENPVHRKRFSTGKRAAQAAIKAGGCAYIYRA